MEEAIKVINRNLPTFKMNLIFIHRSLSPVSSMSGDELSYMPTLANQNAQSNNLFGVLPSVSTQSSQGGSKRFSRRQRSIMDKQVHIAIQI